MRRVAALFAALVLVASLSGASLAATPARSSFTGDFDLVAEDGTLLGHATVRLFEPTDQRLVPGVYDFMGAAGNWIRESHAVIGAAHFWFDAAHDPAGSTIPGGYVARAEGVECVYEGPNAAICHEWTAQFVDNVDPAVRDEVMFTWRNSDDTWGEATQFVGKGSFVLRFSGTES